MAIYPDAAPQAPPLMAASIGRERRKTRGNAGYRIVDAPVKWRVIRPYPQPVD